MVNRRQKRAVALLFALVALGSLGASAQAAPPTYKGASADGGAVFFESDEQLVPGDTDNKRDIYVRSFDPSVGEDGGEYVTRQVSVGPAGGNDSYNALFERASADGTKAFFSTEESLVAADTDKRTDVYMRDLVAGTTTLVSRGAAGCAPSCGNGNFDAGFAGATADGSRVFLVTLERLDEAADTDAAVDVYVRDLDAESTSLVSRGGEGCVPACGNGAFNATLRGLSADGSRAFFATAEKLTAADTDTAVDIYARDVPAGPTALISAGDPSCSPCGNDSAFAAVYEGSSADGNVVFFATAEGLVPDDADGASDIYRRAAGLTTLVSDGSAQQPASFRAASSDGSRVFFVTSEALVGGDVNGANDVYVWAGEAPALVTTGSCCGSTFGAAVDDGEIVFFTTTEAIDPGDEDGAADVYAQALAGGAPTLVSAGSMLCAPGCGNGGADARFNRASADGSRAFFTTDEKLAVEDFDGDDDIYARDLGTGETTLETPPPGLCPTSGCDATFVDASLAADRAFFQTFERLVAADVDSEPDIYERGPHPGLGATETRLVSTGNDPELNLGPEPPVLTATDPASPGVSTEPAILGTAKGGSAIKIYSTSSCSGEPVATGTAEQLASPGLKVSVPAATTRSFWATAEAEGFASLCSSPITYRQESPPPPPPPPADGGPSGGGTGGGTSPGGGGRATPRFDYVTPVAKITFGPIFKTRQARPVFRFTDTTGQPGTRFRCRVDRQRWKACGSPLRLAKLKVGKHVFRVRAVNAVGVVSDRVAKRAFKRVPR